MISPNCSVPVILQHSSLRRAGPFLSCSTLITDVLEPCAIMLIIACSNLAAPPTLEKSTSPECLAASFSSPEPRMVALSFQSTVFKMMEVQSLQERQYSFNQRRLPTMGFALKVMPTRNGQTLRNQVIP